MPSESCAAVDNFLRDVDEQISCKTGLDSVNRELRGHIEEKAELYMEYGVEEKEAYRRAVRDMGAPDVVGMELNKHHRLRTAIPLLVVILLLMAVGVTGEVLQDGIEWSLYDILYEISDKRYYLWGLLVLFLVMRFGYPFLLKHTKGICILFLIVCLVLGFLYLWPYEGLYVIMGRIANVYRSSVYFGLIQLAVLVAAVLFYRKRHNGLSAFVWLLCYQAGIILIGNFRYWDTIYYIPSILLLMCCLGISLYVVKKHWIHIHVIKGIIAAFLSFLVLLIFWAAPKWNSIKENWNIFIDPGERASTANAWDDSYNNVLIRELLGRAEAFGEIRLTEEEMIQYGTSEWYYEDGPGNWNGGKIGDSGDAFDSLEGYVKYKMQHLTEPSLQDILPQYNMENYRISWWVLRYGWVPAILLTLLCLALPVLALWTACRIRNHLGRLTALAGALALTVQTIFYIIGSLGYQFGAFSNLPFVSEGTVSITGSAVLAGLILSAYRFDTVIKETAEPAISSDSGTPEDRHRKTQE